MSTATVYRLKPAFQNLLRPTTARLASAGVSANHVTIAAFIVAAAAGVVAAVSDSGAWLTVVPFLYLVRMALNAIDGVLAREHSRPTVTGRILNEVGDVAGDAAAYLPFIVIVPSPWTAGLLAVVVIAGISTEVIALVAAADGARANDGPFGKSDRAVAFGLLALTVWLAPAFAGALLVAMLGLALVTMANRTRSAGGS